MFSEKDVFRGKPKNWKSFTAERDRERDRRTDRDRQRDSAALGWVKHDHLLFWIHQQKKTKQNFQNLLIYTPANGDDQILTYPNKSIKAGLFLLGTAAWLLYTAVVDCRLLECNYLPPYKAWPVHACSVQLVSFVPSMGQKIPLPSINNSLVL